MLLWLLAQLFPQLFLKEISIQWQRVLGGSMWDVAQSIQQTLDGGYIVVGYTSSNNGNVSGNHGRSDFWIIKLDKAGRIVWQKVLGGSNHDHASDVQQTSDGGYIVVGSTYSNDMDVSGNRGKSDYWIVKLDYKGNIQWKKTLGGSNEDWAESVEQTRDGGYIIAGTTRSYDVDAFRYHGSLSPIGGDFWIVKLDRYGNVQWQKVLGGTDDDYAYSIHQTSDGGYIVAGWTFSNDGDVYGYHGGGDGWVVKLNQNGNIQWQKTLGGFDEDILYSIQETRDGGYIAVGRTRSFYVYGKSDFWIVKLDHYGNIQWQKVLGGSGNDWAYSVQQTKDGGYIVAGYTDSNDGDVRENHGGKDSWIVKLDSRGNIEWQISLGGSKDDVAYSLLQTFDGGYIVAGSTWSNDGDVKGNHGLIDLWIVKLGF